MRGVSATGRACLKRSGGLAIAVALGLSARDAAGYDARVDATFDAQYYSLSSPFGDPYIYRRRYTSTLGLELDDLQGERTRRGPRLSFRSRLRVDGDFGQEYRERDPSSNGYVPGLAQSPLDVMFAYVDGRGFVNGLFNFRLGRQYLIDALGYWSFDGALLEAMLPVHLALSGFVGFEQRTGLPLLAGARFSGDGVWRGDRTGLEQNQYPAFLDDSSLAPARGVAIETWGFKGFHSRLSYRRVENQSPVLVSAFFDPREPLRFVKVTRTSSDASGSRTIFEPKPTASPGVAMSRARDPGTRGFVTRVCANRSRSRGSGVESERIGRRSRKRFPFASVRTDQSRRPLPATSVISPSPESPSESSSGRPCTTRSLMCNSPRISAAPSEIV